MNIQSINNTPMSFRAKIRFENSKHLETMPNIIDDAYGRRILDEIGKYCPKNNEIVIKLVKAANQRDSYMEALNTLTQKKLTQRLLPSDYDKDFDSTGKYTGGSDTLYALLNSLIDINSSAHNIFWGHCSKDKSHPPLSEHKTFKAE